MSDQNQSTAGNAPRPPAKRRNTRAKTADQLGRESNGRASNGQESTTSLALAGQLQQAIASLRRLEQHQVDMAGHVLDLHDELAELRGAQDDPAYTALRRDIRALLRDLTPLGATVAIATRGDDRLLNLLGQVGTHFPAEPGGRYLGYYPETDLGAIAQVELARANGAAFLLFPTTALWWLQNYEDLDRHLRRHYREISVGRQCGALFDLAFQPDHGWPALERTLRERPNDSGAEPSILDWATNLNLAGRLHDHPVISWAENGSLLPHLDQSVEFVAVATDDPLVGVEASRVATKGVIRIIEPPRGASMSERDNFRLEVDWTHAHEEDYSHISIIVGPGSSREVDMMEAAVRSSLPSPFAGRVVTALDTPTERSASHQGLHRNGTRPYQIDAVSAMNAAARSGDHSILIFLHQAVVLPGWLAPLLDVLAVHPECAAACGMLLTPGGELASAGATLLSEGTLARVGAGDKEIDAPWYQFSRRVETAPLGVVAVRREVFDAVGGLAGGSSPDVSSAMMSHQARLAGWSTRYDPRTVAIDLSPEPFVTLSTAEMKALGLSDSREPFRQPLPMSKPNAPASWHEFILNASDQTTRRPT